jgi:hypothetical protein
VAKIKLEKRIEDAIRTCEAITRNLEAKGYTVGVVVTITNKKTGTKREIEV